MVRPLTCEEISPLLVSAMAPPVKKKPADLGVAAESRPQVRITPVGPTVNAARRAVHLHRPRGTGDAPSNRIVPDERLSRRKAQVGLAFGQMRRREGRAAGDLGPRAVAIQGQIAVDRHARQKIGRRWRRWPESRRSRSPSCC